MSSRPKDGPPAEPGSGNPSPMSDSSGHTRLVIDAITGDITVLKNSIASLVDGRREDQKYILTVFATGFLALAGMIIGSYLLLDGKISSLKETSIRVDTKLEELLKRIPPAPLTAPK